MHIINVDNDYGSGAEIRCDCGMWKSRGRTDIEIMAKSINHLNDAHSHEGVIEFPSKYIVITDSNITVLEK